MPCAALLGLMLNPADVRVAYFLQTARHGRTGGGPTAGRPMTSSRSRRRSRRHGRGVASPAFRGAPSRRLSQSAAPLEVSTGYCLETKRPTTRCRPLDILSSPGLVESGLPTRAGAPLPSHSLAGVCGAQGVLHARQQTRSAAVLAAAPRVANRRSRGGAPASLSSDLSLRQLLRPACVERDKSSIT